VICPTCKAEGKESGVIHGGSDTTLMACPQFYDEKNQLHHHDGNDVRTMYRCTNGHEWTEHSTSKCWCGWPNDPNWKDAKEPGFQLSIREEDIPKSEEIRIEIRGDWQDDPVDLHTGIDRLIAERRALRDAITKIREVIEWPLTCDAIDGIKRILDQMPVLVVTPQDADPDGPSQCDFNEWRQIIGPDSGGKYLCPACRDAWLVDAPSGTELVSFIPIKQSIQCLCCEIVVWAERRNRA
jgi:hypothetical protein